MRNVIKKGFVEIKVFICKVCKTEWESDQYQNFDNSEGGTFYLDFCPICKNGSKSKT